MIDYISNEAGCRTALVTLGVVISEPSTGKLVS